MTDSEGPAGADVLFIDDETHIRRAGAQALELAGLRVRALESAEAGLAALDGGFAGVVVSDIRMPGLDGLDFLRRVRRAAPDLPVVLITGHGDVAMAVEAMKEGACDFLEKPFPNERLIETVQRARDRLAMSREIAALRREVEARATPGLRLLGESAAIRQVRERLARVARSDADALILGETGSGKEVAARTLHAMSNRRDKRFVAVNCGAVPETMMESELFGHEAGAFTGATGKRVGKMEHADGGSLLLDEIESMPHGLQVALLRVLEQRVVERLGSNTPVPLDLRVVAASKKDLKATAEAGRFREDLFYRLEVVTLRLPPLRERPEDIPLLFRHFVQVTCARSALEAPEIPPAVMAELVRHAWPGNVRELANTAERFVLFGDLEEALSPTRDTDGPPPAGDASLPRQVEAFEASLIGQALRRTHGDVTAATALLGVPRKTLYDKMKKHALSRRDFLEG